MQRHMWPGVVWALLLVILPSCTHPAGFGDRAFEAGDYSAALRFYEEGMVDGAHDSRLYHRAAQSAMRIGSFSTAERYYSLSLRYGGGIDVATDLATFYVQTSNYARAVRVYQFLLKNTDNPQPVYNNLGTALMYAGLPFDAESYLLLAQQMEPKNPLPYINLGVLYDQHLKQPLRAQAFFVCFMEMSPKPSASTRVVQSRLDEMKLRPTGLGTVEGLVCGESYVPVQRAVGNLRQYFEGPEWEDGSNDKPEKVIELGLEETEGEDVAEAVETRVIEESATKSFDDPKALASARERAEVALKTKKYDQVVRELSEYPVDKLEAGDMLLLGQAFVRNGRTKEAVTWLEWSFKREPAPRTLEVLLDLLLMLDEGDRVSELCTRYTGQSEFESATKRCKVTENGD